MSPEETLHALKEQANNRTRRTLDAIYGVCIQLESHGDCDFSYTTISKIGKDKGVPRAQSIRNKTGEKYRTLIKSFVTSTKNKKIKYKRKKQDSWIDDIAEPRLKLLVQMQAAKLAEAERIIKEIIPPNLEIRVNDNLSASDGYRLNELERKALEYLNSEEFLTNWGLHLGRHGDVLDKDGKKVFKVATTDAINKALNFLV